MPSPDAEARAAAEQRLAELAVPKGALGRLGELGVWICAVQGRTPPDPLDDVRLVVFAGDHGVAAHGVSAYPAEVTPAMVRVVLQQRAGVSALAAVHDVRVRVVDVGVDDELAGVPDRVSGAKVRRGSGAIHLEDALSPAETTEAIALGARIASEEIAAGGQLLISGDLGIGNTTPAAALIGALLDLPAEKVVGRGTGVDDERLAHKTGIVAQALARVGGRTADPKETLTALGSADLAATTGYMLEAARRGVPLLLDGVAALACALVAERIAPGTAAWCAAGHRSTEPAQTLALVELGLEPLLDLRLRLGEGSGAVAAVPLLRSAVALLRDVAPLAEVVPR